MITILICHFECFFYKLSQRGINENVKTQPNEREEWSSGSRDFDKLGVVASFLNRTRNGKGIKFRPNRERAFRVTNYKLNLLIRGAFGCHVIVCYANFNGKHAQVKVGNTMSELIKRSYYILCK